MFTFTCEKCGGQFYSTMDPSGWRHKLCNACAGRPYKDKPVEGTQPIVKPVPTTKPVYNNVQSQSVPKKEFNLEEYIGEMLDIYSYLSTECDKAKLTIPMECLCSWTTSIMIQKGKLW